MDYLPIVALAFTAILLSILSLLITLKTRRLLSNIVRLIETYPRVFERLAKAVELKKKIRKRYIVFRVLSQDKITRKELDKAIRDTIRSVIGVKGLADTSYMLIDYDEQLRLGIVRSNNRTYKIVIGLLGLVRNINNKRIIIIPVSTHGTIRKAREKIKSLSK